MFLNDVAPEDNSIKTNRRPRSSFLFGSKTSLDTQFNLFSDNGSLQSSERMRDLGAYLDSDQLTAHIAKTTQVCLCQIRHLL